MSKRIATATATHNKTIRWGTGIFLVASHAAAVAALFFWSWQAIVCAVILYWIAGSLGIGMGFHRLLTHRGYHVPRIVEYFLVIVRHAGPGRWSNSVGNHTPDSSRAYRQAGRSAHAAGRWLVGPHRVDFAWYCAGPQSGHDRALRAGFNKESLLCLAG